VRSRQPLRQPSNGAAAPILVDTSCATIPFDTVDTFEPHKPACRLRELKTSERSETRFSKAPTSCVYAVAAGAAKEIDSFDGGQALSESLEDSLHPKAHVRRATVVCRRCVAALA
jgi:hypothetical protein